jgi:hypothetical protein
MFLPFHFYQYRFVEPKKKLNVETPRRDIAELLGPTVNRTSDIQGWLKFTYIVPTYLLQYFLYQSRAMRDSPCETLAVLQRRAGAAEINILFVFYLLCSDYVLATIILFNLP